MSFLRSENRRRLIKNKNVGSAIKHLYDFNSLLFGNGHFINFLFRVQLKAIFFAYGLDALDGTFYIEFFTLDSKNYVLGSSENVNQLEMLVYHTDLVVECVLG